MKIHIDYEELYALKNQMCLSVNNLSLNLNHIESLILSLPEGWQGNIEIKFANKLITIKREYEKLLQFLSRTNSQFENIAFDYEKFDAELQAKLNSI